jgi:hypothetical protein
MMVSMMMSMIMSSIIRNDDDEEDTALCVVSVVSYATLHNQPLVNNESPV